MLRVIISLFLLGLSFGIGPCLASCGPLLISYIAGTEKDVLKSIWAYSLFSLSRIFVYLVLTLVIFFFGQTITKVLGFSSKYLFILGGIFIITIGILNILGKNLNYKFCNSAQDLFLKRDTKTIITFGLIIGLLPCAPFISVVSYIGLVAKHWANSLFYSLAFGAGTLVSPLFFLVVLAGLIPKIMINNHSVNRIFNFVCNLIIIFLGFQLLRKAF